jgi:hypothetical protein
VSIVSIGVASIASVLLGVGDLAAQTVTRAPYLQLGTPDSVIVRWRTDSTVTGRVRFGTDPANLTSFADTGATATEHAVTLSGLAPDTRYFYSVGTTTATLAAGPDQKFVTSPPAGVSKPIRVWVIGDAGTGTSSQVAVRNAFTSYNGNRETDLWLVLGDNAYDLGSDAEYQVKHFAIYPALLKSAVSWYTLGNHDAGTGAAGAHPYHAMFSLPTMGQAGGAASGTKNYYSFNYGNVHFISLDSQETNRASTGAMASWLTRDLQNNTLPWVIAFWHHPPYSKGSHDSDTEINLVEMRSNMLPILEQYGVDLVLSGHSHSYERSYLLDGHYGVSGTLTTAMKKNSGSGRSNDTGVYAKPSVGPAGHEGAVYVVAGSSGQTSGFQPSAPHPAMYISLNNLGSLVLDLNGERLDVTFLREDGSTPDTFTLVKGIVQGNVPPDVSMTSPLSGSSYTSPTSIMLSANATDLGGSISLVSFYNGPTLLGTVSGSSPYSLTWNNPPPGSHRLTARATDNNNATHISAPVFITVNAATIPAAPTALAFGPVTSSSVSLNWTDNAANETGYQVERAPGGGGFTMIAALGANATTHVDTMVSPSTAYDYRVRATSAAGNSAYSNTASVTTPVGPAAPSALVATAASTSQINLRWTDNASNETGFKITRSLNGTSFTQIATVGANATTYSDTGLARNKRYYYRVGATNANGDSAYSNVASAKTPNR